MRKKLLGVLSLALFTGMLSVGCGQKQDAPFQTENAQSMEIYRYVLPVEAEKKVVTDSSELETACVDLISAGNPKNGEVESGGTVISFRVNLKDGSTYELVCMENGSESLKKYEAIWDEVSAEAVSAEEEELPKQNET